MILSRNVKHIRRMVPIPIICLGKETDKILQKLGGRVYGNCNCSEKSEPENIKYEISDFLYHCMVLMVEKGITWEEIANELAQR